MSIATRLWQSTVAVCAVLVMGMPAARADVAVESVASAPATTATTVAVDGAVLEAIQRAVVLLKQGEIAQVRELLVAAAAGEGPRPAALSVALGKGLSACGAWPEAVKALEEARASGEATPDLEYYLGVAYFHVRRDAECAAVLGAATLMSAEARAGGRYYLGLALARLGRVAEARAQLMRRPVAAEPVAAVVDDEPRDVNSILER